MRRCSDNRTRRIWLAGGVALWAGMAVAASQAPARPQAIELEVSPRLCTLSARDERCETVVRATWRSARNESLCLIIAGFPQVKACWEDHREGEYSVALTFAEDLVVELKDTELQNVLAAATITVIREAIELRRKRRQPWSIL